MTYMLCLIL